MLAMGYNEQQIMQTVSHPFIVRTLHCSSSEGYFTYVMEYCSGKDLYHLLHSKPEGRLPESDVKFYVACLVFLFRHLREILVYGDIKPENVVIHADGYPRLIDFGLSRLIKGKKRSHVDVGNAQNKGATSNPKQTKVPAMGSADYISPEQLEGEAPSYINDWWGLGILTFELIYGFPPFGRGNKFDTMEAIRTEEFDFPSSPETSEEC